METRFEKEVRCRIDQIDEKEEQDEKEIIAKRESGE